MHRIVNRSFALVGGLLLLGSGLSGCGSKAPQWSFSNSDGTLHSLSDYQGQVLMLAFTNTWCEPCERAAPHLQDIHDRFADQGVTVMAVSSWERYDPTDYMDQYGYTYDVMLDGTDIARQYGVDHLPTFYIIGVDGSVIFQEEGFNESTAKKMTKTIKKHLKKNSGKVQAWSVADLDDLSFE